MVFAPKEPKLAGIASPPTSSVPREARDPDTDIISPITRCSGITGVPVTVAI